MTVNEFWEQNWSLLYATAKETAAQCLSANFGQDIEEVAVESIEALIEARHTDLEITVARRRLVCITRRKAVDHVRYHQAQKRDVAKVTSVDSETAGTMEPITSGNLTPLEALLLAEEGKVVQVIAFMAAVEASPIPVPEKALERLRSAVLRTYGPAAVAAAAPKPLSSKEMEVVALRILSEKPMDGFDLAASLRKAGIQSKEGGEGTLYGVLSRLESSGHLEGRWRPRGARMVKTYHLTEKGTGSLRKSSALAGQFESLCQAAMKFDPTAG